MQEQSDNKIIVSVIITTKEESDNISNCLESVIQQNYPKEKMEIIVVDNSSLDRTIEIAKRYTDKVYTFGPNRSAQLNFGANIAKGKYVLLPDADMILSKGVIEECVDKCEGEGFIALYIPERIIGRGFLGKIRDFERSFYNMTCIDAVRFIKKDKFSEIGGFEESITGPEDWDFDRRIKEMGKVNIIDTPLYHNEGRFNLREYLKKKRNYSKKFNNYIKKWGRNDPLIRKQFGLFYRYFGVFIEQGKWKKLLRHPLLFIQVFLLKILVGIVFLMSKLKKTQAAQGSIIIK